MICLTYRDNERNGFISEKSNLGKTHKGHYRLPMDILYFFISFDNRIVGLQKKVRKILDTTNSKEIAG
jgi:hypothetical protein